MDLLDTGGISDWADMMDRMKTELVARGWDSHNAEQMVITQFAYLAKTT